MRTLQGLDGRGVSGSSGVTTSARPQRRGTLWSSTRLVPPNTHSRLHRHPTSPQGAVRLTVKSPTGSRQAGCGHQPPWCGRRSRQGLTWCLVWSGGSCGDCLPLLKGRTSADPNPRPTAPGGGTCSAHEGRRLGRDSAPTSRLPFLLSLLLFPSLPSPL